MNNFDFLMLVLMVFQHVLQVRFMCLPPSSFSLNLSRIVSIANVFRNPKHMPYTVHTIIL